MSFTWDGMDELLDALDKYPNVALKTMRVTLYQEAEKTMTHIKQSDLVPFDLGALESSAFVEDPKQSLLGEVSVKMGFGGDASAYALAQHERTDYNHTVGGPKYLERPVNKRRKQIIAELTKNILIAMKKAAT